VITQIEGRLVALVDGAAHVRVGDVTYEVLVPAADSMALAASLGGPVAFHTLHYMEGQGQGSSFWPRLIGFRSARDRAFFELFTTVKGIGNRKALRALQMPFVRVARAIADRDLDTLQSLPEIGKRTAEAICVELRGKVDVYATAPERARAAGTAAGAPGSAPGSAPGADAGTGAEAASTPAAASMVEAKAGKPRGRARAEAERGAETAGRATDAPATRADDDVATLALMANTAVDVLVQLGHARVTARELVERVLVREERPASIADLVTAALR
jgi:Holliday junction DNA helicase RuvA